MSQPPNDDYRRGPKGRFGPGNKGGSGGNELASKASQLRMALVRAVSPADIEDIAAALVEKAKQGEVPAAKEVFDRCLGKAEAVDLLERIGALEELLEAVAAEGER